MIMHILQSVGDFNAFPLSAAASIETYSKLLYDIEQNKIQLFFLLLQLLMLDLLLKPLIKMCYEYH